MQPGNKLQSDVQGHAQRYLLKAADKSAVAIMFGIAYAAATVLSVQAGSSLEIGEDVFENNCGRPS